MAYPLPEPDPQDLVPVPTTFVEVNGVRLPVGGAYETVQRLGLADPAAYLPGGALFQGPIQPADDDPSWYRDDGTKKGQGFLGRFELPGGGVASEYSIADSERLIDLKDHRAQWRDYPTLVPTLTPAEVQQTLHAITNKTELPDAVKQKAEAFAIQRARQGKPLFATAAESPLRVGDQTIEQPPLAVSHGPTSAGAEMSAPRLAVSHGTENRPPKPMIGPSQVGDRYEPPSWGEIMTMDNPFLGLMEHLVGPSRPSSVATQDPYGASAFLKGAGPPPLMVGSTEPVGGLYSRVERALGQIPEAGAHPNKILSVLKSNASPEEVAYRGVPEFLAGKTRVTRGELQAHLAEHPAPMPTVKTLQASTPGSLAEYFTEQGTSAPGTPDGWTYLADDMTRRAQRLQRDGDRFQSQRYFRLAEDATSMAEGVNVDTGSTAGQPKYQQYQVPGGERYRETMLTLPQQKIEQLIAEQMHVGEQMRATGTTPALVDSYNQLQAQINATPAPYQSGHFDEPNIVVHTRSHERTLPTGERGRFVEEVQSDWHQKGKKEGYAQDTKGWTAKSLAEPDAGFTHWEIIDAAGNYVTKIVGGTKESAIRKAAERGVPDAPFKESWPDLGLKQQLLEAAQDPDAQWLGFTSGQTQADRYNLRKQISALYYDPKEQRLIAMGHESSGATGAVIDRDGIAPEQLADYVGKEAAQKLIDAPLQSKRFAGDLRSVHALTDTELEVGGEGMKHFYDNVLPKRLEKIVKPFGGTVERTTLKTMDEVQQLAGSEPAWIVRLTPAMKARILKEGLPLMALAPVALAVSHEQQPPPKAPPLAVSHPAVAATFPRFTEALDHTRTR